MASGVQKLALQRLNQEAPELNLPQATITAVTAGASTDGQSLVTVSYQGASLKLPYMAHYTPVVGHTVPVARIDGVLTILGRPIGFPPTT